MSSRAAAASVEMAGIKIRTQRQTDYLELKLLIVHPMENGRNRDPLTGELIPAHFIQELHLTLNGQPLLSADLGGSVSKNPYLSFRLLDTRAGDRIEVIWLDNRLESGSAVHVIDE